MKTVEERFWSKVNKDTPSDCWEWTAGKNKNGYGLFSLNRRDYKAFDVLGKAPNKMILAHRLAWVLCYGLIPFGKCVLHECDNPGCINPVHMFLGTKMDNTNDMVNKGRAKYTAHYGEDNWNSKLSAEQIESAKEKYANGITQTAIAEKLGVSQEAISYHIMKG